MQFKATDVNMFTEEELDIVKEMRELGLRNDKVEKVKMELELLADRNESILLDWKRAHNGRGHRQCNPHPHPKPITIPNSKRNKPPLSISKIVKPNLRNNRFKPPIY